MKNIHIFYNCAFCRVGILVCLEPDHVKRGRRGMPTHFLSQDGNTQRNSVVQSHLQIKHCAAQSHSFFCFDRGWHVVCLSFPPRHVFPFVSSARYHSPPSLFSSWDVRSTYIKLWNLRIWRYFLTLQGCICTVSCYLLLYYYSYNINLLTTWYLMPSPYKLKKTNPSVPFSHYYMTFALRATLAFHKSSSPNKYWGIISKTPAMKNSLK